MLYSDINKAKIIVSDAGKRLLKEGLVARTWGNVSVKVSQTHMVITPSGRRYDELTPEDMVLVNFHTLKYEGNLKPSSELKLHAQVYKTRPNINSVIHTHQMYASIIAVTQKDIKIINPEHQGILGAEVIKAAPYALPNTKKITLDTAKAIDTSHAAIMSNHGAICIGKTLEDAFRVAQTLEAACKDYLASQKS